MSSKNPKITKVKLRVLEIEETPVDTPNEAVIVELSKGASAGTVTSPEGETITIYFGEMTYQRPGSRNKKSVDFVEAIFIPNDGTNNEPGNIRLVVNLTCDNEFIDPPVTTIPTDPNSIPTRCLTIERGHSANQIVITFEEPAQGQFVAYPALYFNTTAGILDPGIGVNRKPD